MKKIWKVMLSSALAISMLSACGGAGSTGTTTKAAGAAATTKAAGAAAGTTAAGAATTKAAGAATTKAAASSGSAKTLRIAAVDPQVPLDMMQNTYTIIMRITDNVTESLLTTLDDGSLKPVLLKEMPTLSSDKLTYSFTLKSGVKFHDGTALTSKDVKFSLERLVKMKSMSSLMENVVGYDTFSKGTSTEMSGIKVVDDTHFTITLTKIYTPFTATLSTPYACIYPQAACEKAGDDWGKKVLIGTGPFKLDSYTTGSGAELSAFADYHEGAPKIGKISYKFIEDANTQVLEYQKGNIDFLDLDNALYPVYANTPKIKDEMHFFQAQGGYYFNFNVKTISDPKVREAIALSIDRKSICDSVLHGTASVPTSFIPKGLIGHSDTAKEYEYDPAKAKSLLAEAGFANGYSLRITVNTKNNLGKSIATAYQEQAKASGITVNVETVDSAAWTDMKKNGTMDCSTSNWYVDYSDPDSMLYPVSDKRVDLVSSFWHNADFKKLMEQGVETDDKAAREKIYEEAESILCRKDFAITPLINEKKFYLLNPKVTGFEIGSANRLDLSKADIQ
jgi:ABC-type transport system substrate-binding protein